jgi:hypothetical protein
LEIPTTNAARIASAHSQGSNMIMPVLFRKTRRR